MMSDCFGNANIKCELKSSGKLGRYVVAARDLRAGELLLLEQPAIVGPYWDSKLCCLSCYCESAVICIQCKVAPLCCKCIAHDPVECEFLRTAQVHPNFLIDNFDLITPLRCILLARDLKRDKTFEEVFSMESHCNERRDTEIWHIHTKKVITPMLSMHGFLKANETDDWLHRICGILDVNTFEVRTPYSEVS